MSDLNDLRSWRQLYGAKSRRLKDMEMILRFFAFYFHEKAYRRPMKDFLNRYMAGDRNLQRETSDDLKRAFVTVANFIDSTIGHQAFRPARAINAAVVDSVLVGAARRLSTGPITNAERFRKAYHDLLENANYKSSIETGTSQETNVQVRMGLATTAFRDIP